MYNNPLVSTQISSAAAGRRLKLHSCQLDGRTEALSNSSAKKGTQQTWRANTKMEVEFKGDEQTGGPRLWKCCQEKGKGFFSIVDVSAELYTHSHNTALVKNTDVRGVWWFQLLLIFRMMSRLILFLIKGPLEISSDTVERRQSNI